MTIARAPQHFTAEGVVICDAPDCHHQALHHAAHGCRFCRCAWRGDQFEYIPKEPPMAVIEDRPEPMLQFFEYEHLPPHLQVASKPFCDLATLVVDTFPRNPERTVTLRKLLEAKDCAVRAVLYK